MSQSEARVIEGDIVFEELDSAIANVAIHVRLEDVSLADAPSKTVAQAIVRDVSLDLKGTSTVPFRLEHPPLEANNRYTLAVHADVDDTGQVKRGDHITMQSFPVPPSGPRPRIEVRVRPVR